MIKTARGFTLIEMAIVLIIITILIGGLAVPLSAQIQARRIAETRQILQDAREAVLGYAMTHPAVTVGNRYLPCPDQDGNGTEDRILNNPANGCAITRGWLPWVTLGTASQDAWGNRLQYTLDTDFAHGTNGFSSSTALANPLQICSTHTCVSPDVAANVVFTLISRGPNGWGARNISGSTLAAPTGADELENQDADQTYISRSPTKADAASGEFDDLLMWVAHGELISRICPPGSDCSPSSP